MIRPFFLTLLALPVLVAVSACGGGVGDIADAALSSRDVPAAWLPADLDEAQGQILWSTLPQVLNNDADARLIIHAFEADSGLHGAATLFVETDEPTAIPDATSDEDALGPLSLFLMQEDALLLPDVIGGDPDAYFSASDTPVADAVRSRLVRLIDDDLIHSDSLTFNVGNVLAVVTVWYPEEEGPVQDLNEIAAMVESRLQSVVKSS